MEILLVDWIFLLLLVLFFMLVIGLALRQKLSKSFFASTPEGIGRLSLKEFELIDCNLPLAEALGFLGCHDCLQSRVELDCNWDDVSPGPMICDVIVESDVVKTIELRVLALVENRHLDFMIIGETEKFDLFNQLPLPLLKLDREMVIIDLNPSANQVFGENKKGLPVSTLMVASYRNRITSILLNRSNRHESFSLSVPIVLKNGDSLIQKWRITSKSPEELMLSCFSIEKNKEEIWLYYEQVCPGQSVFWELDLSNAVIRHDHIGDAWQHNFNLEKGTSFVTWLAMVHPQDRRRVSREFESFFLHPKSQLNSTYRMASIQGLELAVTSIGTHSNARLTKGIHQIIESHHLGDKEQLSNKTPASEFSALCRSMGLKVKWIDRGSKILFPVDFNFREIISSILGDNKDIKEICIESFQPNGQKVQCTSCGEEIKSERFTLTISIPDMNFPQQHITQILKYGYHSQELLLDESIELGEEQGEELGEEIGIQERIHLSGGHLTVKASNGSMVFVIFLPEEEANETVAVQGLDSEAPVELNATIQNLLIVDDQEVVLRYLCETLKLEGYQVTGFSSSIEALAHFESDPLKYDLVITDQNMAGLSGTDIIGLMLEMRPKLPIVLCSGQDQRLGEQTACDLGALAFFRKPLDMQKLVSLCRSQVNKAG